MGIPNYFYHVLTNHGNIIKKLYFHRIHNLYLDSNSLVYDSVYEYDAPIENNMIIYELVYNKIINIIETLKPHGITYVSFDGVAPVAKLVQQKQRRYKSNLIKEVLDKPSTQWNTNNITPGTEFMNGLNKYMKMQFQKNPKVIFSGSDEPGEGEHKICHYIRSNFNSKDNTENHCIYGLDADLIMLGLILLRDGYNMFLYRETKYFDYIPKIEKDEKYIFDLFHMGKQLCNSIKYDNMKGAINDYCFLCYLCGNDFLPHFSSINIRNNGIHYLIDAYTECGVHLINDQNKINWIEVNKLFVFLSNNENQNTIENIHWKIEKSKNIRAKNSEEKLNILPLTDKDNDIYILNNMEKYDDIVFNHHNMKKICKNYLEMLEWTWEYYNGNVLDTYLYYHFSHAPRFHHLRKYTPIQNNDCILKKQPNEIISSTTQLLYVLPTEDHSQHFNKKFLNNIYDKFPELTESNFDVDYTFCKYFWEAHVEINYVNVIELNNHIRKVNDIKMK